MKAPSALGTGVLSIPADALVSVSLRLVLLKLVISAPFAALSFHTLGWVPAFYRLVTQTVLFVKSTYGVDEIMSMAVPVYVHRMAPAGQVAAAAQPPDWPPGMVTLPPLPFSA